MKEYSEESARKIMEFAKEHELHPDFDEEGGIISFLFDNDSSFDTIRIAFDIAEDHIVSFASTNFQVKENARLPFAELIARINNDRVFGCLEIDMEDGSFDFRHMIDLGSGSLTDEQIDNVFQVSFYVFENYDEALLKVMLGMATAKEAYEAVKVVLGDEDPDEASAEVPEESEDKKRLTRRKHLN